MTNYFDGSDQYLDPRDVEEQIEELAAGIEEFNDQDDVTDEDRDARDEAQELLDALIELRDDAAYAFSNQETLIHEDYFTDAMRELVEDCYSITAPDFLVIDWEATADNLRVDYSEVEFQGTTYYYR